VAIHVDEDGIAQDLPRSEEGTPCMIVRLQPMAGGLCRFSYMTSAGDGGERTVIDVGEVMSRIVTTSELGSEENG